MPSPVDRRNGCKRHAISDANGIPLLIHTTPANVRDEVPTVEMVESMPSVKQPRGRPRRKPGELIGDRGYGFPWIIAAIVLMGIRSARCLRGSPHGSGLGKRRYVIERTLSWFSNFRRLKLCYEKTARAFPSLPRIGGALCWRGKLAPSG